MRNHWAVSLGSLLLVAVTLAGCSLELNAISVASTPAPLCLGTTL